jgi:hypothetical protein
VKIAGGKIYKPAFYEPLMSALEKYEEEWEEELEELIPGRVESVEQALEVIEKLALNGYKQIKSAEDVSMERIGELYGKISVMRERLLNIAYLARHAKRILQQRKGG